MKPPMRIACVGGGPAGLYFARLMKLADPRHEVVVLDRALPAGTSGTVAEPRIGGAGIVLSRGALASLEAQDPDLHLALAPWLTGWRDIAVHREGRETRCDGHAFSGLSRARLVQTLAGLASEAGVELRRGQVLGRTDLPAADLVIGADGAHSVVRDLLAPAVTCADETGRNRYIWLTTPHLFERFTFLFRTDAEGLWRAHAYPHGSDGSTVIVECTEATWRAAAMVGASPAEAAARLSSVFADDLEGQVLRAGPAGWQTFVTTRTSSWWHGHTALLGDAAHTAHFSVGSGTRLAMDDATALRDALAAHQSLPAALAAYEAARRPAVESLQRAAIASADWFEHVERHASLDDDRFAFALLTRSQRVTHEDLRTGDAAFIDRVNARVAEEAWARAGVPSTATAAATPPMFTPLRVRNLVLTNRVAVSPMCQYSATEGLVNDWHLVHLGTLAKGGAALVMAEATAVSADGRITEGCAGLYTEAHVAAWRRIVDFAHQHSTAAIGLQLGHAGRKASTLRPWDGPAGTLATGAWPTLAPSAVAFSDTCAVPRAMTRTDMDRVVADFVSATRRASEAGFDWLEVHMAHGYLLASFISPLTNLRTDEYGGTLAGRLRFPLEVFAAVRAAWPSGRPMSARVSATDWASGGLTLDDSVAVARLLREHGCDVVDVSTGGTVADARPVVGRLYQTPFAERIRHDAGVATMAVGAISSWADANTIIAAGRADLCLLARGHLFDPFWTRHAAAAQDFPLAWPPQYDRVTGYRPR